MKTEICSYSTRESGKIASDDRQKSKTLRSRLDIDANAFIDNSFLSERVEAPDYQALCTTLLTYYGSGDSSDAVSQQHLFASLLQREDESPYQYFAALNKLGHNAYLRLSAFEGMKLLLTVTCVDS